MVRKSRTLYEMLERRRTQPRAPGGDDRADGATPVEALRTSIGSVWSRLRGERPAPPAPTRWLISSPTLAGVIFVCLGIGFASGHWLVRPAAAGGADLRATPQRGPEPPGRIPSAPRPGIDLTREEEERAVSQFFFVALPFSPSQRDEASRLALYLREHGIRTARIRQVRRTDQTLTWVTVAYFAGNKDDLAQRQELVNQLKAVPTPQFASDYAEWVKDLSGAKSLREPKNEPTKTQ